MLYWLYYLILLAVLLCGLLLNLFTLPGNWLMLAAVGVYAWVTHWHYVGWITLLILFVLAAVAEVLELFASGAGAKKQGGTRWGTFGALLGGITGGLFLSIGIPILGTFVGILIGTFAGAMLGEMLGGRGAQDAAMIGLGAAKGRTYGTLLKLAFGCVILIISLFASLPWARKVNAAPIPATVPTTAPAGGMTR